MKKLLLICFAYLLASQANAQTTDFNFGVYGGLMHFSGPSSTSSTFMTEAPVNYTNNPYGNKNGVGFGVFIQGQYVTKKLLIAGLQISGDALKSKVDITEAHLKAYPLHPFLSTGHASISSHYINANPYIGKRFVISNIKLDVTGGMEFAYVLDSNDEGSAINKSGQTFLKTNRDVKTIDVDTRLKLGLAAHYDRLGLMISYAHGLSNYDTSIAATSNGSAKTGAHAEVLRLGLSLVIF